MLLLAVFVTARRKEQNTVLYNPRIWEAARTLGTSEAASLTVWGNGWSPLAMGQQGTFLPNWANICWTGQRKVDIARRPDRSFPVVLLIGALSDLLGGGFSYSLG